MRYVVDEGQALTKAKELAARIAQNTPLTNWQITNLLPRITDLSHDDGLFLEYINTSDAAPAGIPSAPARISGKARHAAGGTGQKET